MARYLYFFLGTVMLFQSCTQQESSPEAMTNSDIPAAHSEKTPQLPTTFVDTSGSTYGWTTRYNLVQSLSARITPPPGFVRRSLPRESFGYWLRGLPLKPGKPEVMLHNGQKKERQDVHHAIVDIDVGKRDLQQCADAVMRLRAEYLYSQRADEDIHFKFTSGADCPWTQWKEGYRPVISGSNVSWNKKAEPSGSHANFRAYLDVVFTYAGTSSLEKELVKVGSLKKMEIGDIFIQGGFPGHAVLVMDVAEDTVKGKRMYLLCQSYMPAQEIHVLRNHSNTALSPWYSAEEQGPVETPEWTFLQQDLRRFGGR